MATQGPNSAATITGGAWTNPTNAATTNAVYATQSIPATSDSSILVFSNYGLAIPAGATINGITVAIIAHASVSASIDLGDINALGNTGVKLTKVAGIGVGTAKLDTTLWGTTDSTFTEGNGADLWGTTWTPSDINSTGFGVLVQVENISGFARTASIDSVLITVTFTPAVVVSSSQMFKMF